MDYFQELEITSKLYRNAQSKYKDYVETEIIKFYEKNDYYMFKNFVEYHSSKLQKGHYYWETRLYKLLEDFRISINTYTFTPYTKFNSYCKEKIERIKELRILDEKMKELRKLDDKDENSKLLN